MSTHKTNEELVAEIQSGINPQENLAQLYSQNRKFIAMYAKKYMQDATDADELEDYISFGYFALDEACKKYKPDKGTKFLSFFGWYLHNCFRQYNTKCKLTSIPINVQDCTVKYSRVKMRLAAENGTDPTDEEISAAADLKLKDIKRLKQAAMVAYIGSIDEPVPGQDGGEDMSVADIIADSFDLEESVVQKAHHAELVKIWDVLPEILNKNQTDIVIMFYRDGMTPQEIADAKGKSCHNITTTKRMAVKKLYNSQLLRTMYNSLVGID